MKNLILTSILVFMICVCQSQNKSNVKSIKTNTVPVSKPTSHSSEVSKVITESPKPAPALKNSKDNSKYVGRYYLKNADSLILYDYFDISEDNGKFYCVRESKVIFVEAVTKKVKNTTNHFDCEVSYINIDEEKISFKFNNDIYSYKFKISPNLHRYEIIIIDNALVYEKR